MIKQEGHSGPELFTCTMSTSRISLCDHWGGQFWHQRHYLNKVGSGPLGDATYQISRFSTLIDFWIGNDADIRR